MAFDLQVVFRPVARSMREAFPNATHLHGPNGLNAVLGRETPEIIDGLETEAQRTLALAVRPFNPAQTTLEGGLDALREYPGQVSRFQGDEGLRIVFPAPDGSSVDYFAHTNDAGLRVVERRLLLSEEGQKPFTQVKFEDAPREPGEFVSSDASRTDSLPLELADGTPIGSIDRYTAPGENSAARAFNDFKIQLTPGTEAPVAHGFLPENQAELADAVNQVQQNPYREAKIIVRNR